MKLVADEGVDKPIVDALRSGGFEVRYFAEAGAGTGDKEILAAAQESKARLVLDAIKAHGTEMPGAFTVISPGLLRIRRRTPRA